MCFKSFAENSKIYGRLIKRTKLYKKDTTQRKKRINPIMNIFLLLLLKLLKQLIIRNTINKTDRSITIVLLKTDKSDFWPNVATNIPPKGAIRPKIPKKTVRNVLPTEFITL
jgi:hypothetical protein